MKFQRHASNDNSSSTMPVVPDLLKIDQVCHLVGLSRAMIYKCIADPEIRFPRPIKIGASSRWRRDELHKWTKAKANQ